jgi:hypothetical protein
MNKIYKIRRSYYVNTNIQDEESGIDLEEFTDLHAAKEAFNFEVKNYEKENSDAEGVRLYEVTGDNYELLARYIY